MKKIPEIERIGSVFGKNDSEKFRAWLLLRVKRANMNSLTLNF